MSTECIKVISIDLSIDIRIVDCQYFRLVGSRLFNFIETGSFLVVRSRSLKQL